MELIKIQEKDGKQLVSAKELYEALGFNITHWAKWYKKNIIKNEFAIQFEDWDNLALSASKTVDFVLTLDFAKRLAMMAKTEKGEEVRKYFIECEKKAKENNKPMSMFDLMEYSLKHLRAQDEKINSIQQDVKELKASNISSEVTYFAIMGYASLNKIPVDISIASILGKKARAKCNEMGFVLGKIPDPRFGTVNTYPKDILEIVFKEYFNLN